MLKLMLLLALFIKSKKSLIRRASSDLVFQSHMVQRHICSHKPFKREWGKTVFPQTQQCIINVDKLGNQILQSWTVPKGRTCSSTNESGALILGHFQRGLKPRQALNVH